MTETVDITRHPMPNGRRVTRQVQNLKPGQVITPEDWSGTWEAGHSTEWAIVTGYPVGFQLENRTTRRKRWVWRVPIRYPHETKPFNLEVEGTVTVPVVIPAEAIAEPAHADQG